MKKLALAACCCVAWAVTCYAQTAIRPDQICPGGVCATPDITWAPNSAGTGYVIGSTVPWRTVTTNTATFASTDVASIVELTFAGAITATLPDITTAGTPPPFGSGFGFAIQVGSGTLVLTRFGTQTINGQTSLAVGPYQMVQLLSRNGNWYAVLSGPIQYGTATLYGGTLSAAASFVSFSTPRTVLGVTGRVDAASTVTGTLDVYAAASGTACASGTKLNSTPFNLNGTPNSLTDLGLNGGVAGIPVGAGFDVCFVVTGGGSITNSGSQRLQVSFR